MATNLRYQLFVLWTILIACNGQSSKDSKSEDIDLNFKIEVIDTTKTNGFEPDGYPTIIGGTKRLETLIDSMKAINGNLEKGTVYVSFHVDKNGKGSDFKIVKGTNSSLDSIAMIIIKSLNFEPAIHKNQRIEVRWRLPVKFD